MFHRKKEPSGAVDWLIVGLGNPGQKYENTRHNMGFLAVGLLAQRWNIPVKKMKFQSVYGQGTARGKRVLLLTPQTYMNLSGQAVHACAEFFKVPTQRVLVIYDDAALPTGKLRLRVSGSDGGHNGIKNILYHLHTDAFPRLKIGVGDKREGQDLADHVLSGFSKAEQEVMRLTLDRACDAVELVLDEGVEAAMNRFN